MHGGEPIVSGVRYILAAFLYVDQPRSTLGHAGGGVHAAEDACEVEVARHGDRADGVAAIKKRPRICFQSTPDGGSSFTFGFGE
eukprot:CAMPEP_0183338666 /NCGR_PEP_ID=MMETSP0164_2-20130417/5883_1 /TAXON_ID=221442 /ORGANISM="Coccolithus pelagicus ssp braarudi, Strain PLY182g" /LENGTH=83 /DNA_ID=CAMNT_0025508549 /DNA_START=9 /DNA_END=260 /DNA_ORIENTATION=-